MDYGCILVDGCFLWCARSRASFTRRCLSLEFPLVATSLRLGHQFSLPCANAATPRASTWDLSVRRSRRECLAGLTGVLLGRSACTRRWLAGSGKGAIGAPASWGAQRPSSSPFVPRACRLELPNLKPSKLMRAGQFGLPPVLQRF